MVMKCQQNQRPNKSITCANENAHHMAHKGARGGLKPSLELMPALVAMPRPQRAVTRTTTLQAKIYQTKTDER